MAIGTNYNNNKDKQYPSPTVYSNYKMSNTDGIDPSALNLTFWNGMLKVSIAPMKENNGNMDNISFDHENAADIYLTHIKARLLADEIEEFKKNPSAFKNVGVNTAKALISISNGAEFGITSPVLVIRKIAPDGTIEFSYAYQFKCDYHFSIRNYDQTTQEFDKVYNANMELDMLQTLLIDYYHSMNGAMAYSVLEYGKYNHNRISGSINSIAEKLGVELKSNKNKSFQKQPSIFDSNKGRQYTPADLDDIENFMD